jgi:hypothetical protein
MRARGFQPILTGSYSFYADQGDINVKYGGYPSKFSGLPSV